MQGTNPKSLSVQEAPLIGCVGLRKLGCDTPGSAQQRIERLRRLVLMDRKGFVVDEGTGLYAGRSERLHEQSGCSALRTRRLVESRAQAPGQFDRIVVGPEMHEEQPRLLIEHVTMDRRHLDPV